RGEDCQGSPAPAIAEDKVGAHGDGQEGEPHVSEHRQPSTDPGGRGPLGRPAFRGDERAEDVRRSEELVEHLAVQVEVGAGAVRMRPRSWRRTIMRGTIAAAAINQRYSRFNAAFLAWGSSRGGNHVSPTSPLLLEGTLRTSRR